MQIPCAIKCNLVGEVARRSLRNNSLFKMFDLHSFLIVIRFFVLFLCIKTKSISNSNFIIYSRAYIITFNWVLFAIVQSVYNMAVYSAFKRERKKEIKTTINNIPWEVSSRAIIVLDNNSECIQHFPIYFLFIFSNEIVNSQYDFDIFFFCKI